MKHLKTTVMPVLILVSIFLLALNCGAEDDGEIDADADSDDQAGSGDSDGNADRKFSISSEAFSDGGTIPQKYSCGPESDYRKPSLPLAWSGAPAGTKSFVLLFDDLHQVADGWVHWLLVDIPASVASLPEGASGKSIPSGAEELKNSWGESAYGGPCPPPPTGKHIYRVQLFAMPEMKNNLSFDGRNGRQITETLKNKALGVAELSGTYERSAR